MKTCIMCRESKPLDDFHRRATSKDGHRESCKPCNKARSAERRKNDEIRQRSLEWCANYRASNLESVRARERSLKTVQRRTNRIYERLAQGKARAQRAGSVVERFTSSDLLDYWEAQGIDSTRCFYSGELLDDTFQLDHVVPISRGGPHAPHNIVPCSAAANMSKGVKIVDDGYKIYRDQEGKKA